MITFLMNTVIGHIVAFSLIYTSVLLVGIGAILAKLVIVLAKSIAWLAQKVVWKFLVRNFTDIHGRVDTGRIGQFIGIALMYVSADYAVDCMLSGKELNVKVLTSIAGPGGILMTMYRLKAILGIDGSAAAPPRVAEEYVEEEVDKPKRKSRLPKTG